MFIAIEIDQVHISSDHGESWNIQIQNILVLFGVVYRLIKREATTENGWKNFIFKVCDETLNEFSLDTLFAGIKNSLTDIKEL